MYKMSLGSTLIVSALLMGGCSSKDERLSTESMEEARAQSEALRKHHKQKDLHEAIIRGGENAGWRMTPFKNNAVIAEFFDGDDSLVTTVVFDRYGYDYFPESDISDLSEAIDTQIKREASEEH